MRILRKGQKCENKDCNQDATCLAYSRYQKKVGVYCTWHANLVVDEDYPEYDVECPNCGCGFGVN